MTSRRVARPKGPRPCRHRATALQPENLLAGHPRLCLAADLACACRRLALSARRRDQRSLPPGHSGSAAPTGLWSRRPSGLAFLNTARVQSAGGDTAPNAQWAKGPLKTRRFYLRR
jgi:hypothetical protein